MSMMSVGFKGEKCSVEEAIRLFKEYKSVPQELNLPSVPQPAIEYIEWDNRPQPHKDRLCSGCDSSLYYMGVRFVGTPFFF